MKLPVLIFFLDSGSYSFACVNLSLRSPWAFPTRFFFGKRAQKELPIMA
jgi:hypothetical protein